MVGKSKLWECKSWVLLYVLSCLLPSHSHIHTLLSSLACWCLGYGLSFLYLDVALWSVFSWFHIMVHNLPSPSLSATSMSSSFSSWLHCLCVTYEPTSCKHGHEYATKLSFCTNYQAVWNCTNTVNLSEVSDLRSLDWPIFSVVSLCCSRCMLG
jgi:hypothetical protein